MCAARQFCGMVAIGLLLATVCTATVKYGGGSGTAQDPYQIATVADLIALGETAADYDKHFIVIADIDLGPKLPGRKVFDKAVIAPGLFYWSRFSPYEVSRSGIPFAGVLDGNGHTIWHLTIKTGETVLAGLFGMLRGEVRNLGVTDVNITGSGRPAGGLAADNEGTLIECYGSGAVSGTDHVGGLVGGNRGSVAQCHSMGTVNGDSYVGGLIGINGSWDTPGGSVTRCYSTGVVSGRAELGGLVGENGGVVTECYSSGLVSGTHNSRNLGGLVGQNWMGVEIVKSGSVKNSYSSAIVEGTDFVGGLVGYNGGSVTQCYSAGVVSGEGSLGGLVGCALSFFDFGTTYFCFWDAQKSGQAMSIGGTGKTTAEMQKASTFLNAGWDFAGEMKNGTKDIWWILEGQDYPRLSWERVVFDNFADGKAGPLWTTYEPEPERVWLREVHGRLEVEAPAQEESVDAFYASNGWRLKVSEAFALRVDFHFGQQGVGNGRMNLGLVPSLDPATMRWAEFEVGCFDTGPIYLYEVRDGDWVEEQVTDRSSDGGTLYMSYNPDTDELYFSTAGYGKPNAWKTVRGLLKGRWAGGPVYVILSGGSAGMALTSGDAWFDNFTVNAGVIVR